MMYRMQMMEIPIESPRQIKVKTKTQEIPSFTVVPTGIFPAAKIRFPSEPEC